MTIKVSNFNRSLSNRDAHLDTAPGNKEAGCLSLDEKLMRFDLQLHGGEMMMVAPMGQEFGTQTK